MLFGRYTAFHTLQRILKTAAQRKSIGTTLSHIEKYRENTKNKRLEKNQDFEFVGTRDEMPPKKIKLATKVKNLASLKIANYKKLKLITSATTTEIESIKSESKEINLPSQSSMLKAASESSSIMENAIAKSKLNLRNLRAKTTSEKKTEDSKLSQSSSKRSLRAVVDIEMMKSELKQLQDPPVTEEDKLLSANRLGFEFFDVPSEDLAKNLLGKILVRKLENGTILKGRIVETESYLGGEDKASQTYQNKVTPRNIPMYMPPGTIYVYLTYGMYHCFNVSSRAPGASVFIRALEPTLGKSYMELLRNTQLKRGTKQKEMAKKIRVLKPHQLCNGPSKLCTAFEIDRDTFNEKDITKSPDLWIERDDEIEGENTFSIISAPRVRIDSAGEGSVVLIRALEPIDGMEQMAELRNAKPTANSKSRSLRSFKNHELSNGPSKFCMAFGLNRDHNKYSMCDWKGMWIEEDNNDQRKLDDIKIVQCPRIGIDSAGPEWAMKPLRFYVLGDQSVSKKDKKAEAAMEK